jgi:hypothetical protein
MRKKGISLIVLIITIIVIIILAGAVLINFSKNNPISSANKAKFSSNLDGFNNELLMYNTKQLSNTLGNFDSTKLQANSKGITYTGEGSIDTTGTISDIITGLKGASDITDFEIQNGKLVYVGTDTNKQTWATSIGIALGTAVASGLGVNIIATDNVTINGASASYNNPIIPKGFKAINTPDASWDNVSTDWDKGLVIQDVSGNEFVWVPVDGTNVTYAKWCTTGIAYNDSNISDYTLPSEFNSNNITTKYKGFYIARYESAFDYNGGNIRVASKISTNSTITDWSTKRNETYNGYLWNYINFMDTKTYSENMATDYGYDKTRVETNLITGQEWDTTMKWLQNSGKDVATDSSTWGNYTEVEFNYDYPTPGTKEAHYGTLLVSGASSYGKAKNIYDLAGNLFEWTNETYSINLVIRGGGYNDFGVAGPAGYRSSADFYTTERYIGFRVSLYVL